jgi:hypothetical protein
MKLFVDPAHQPSSPDSKYFEVTAIDIFPFVNRIGELQDAGKLTPMKKRNRQQGPWRIPDESYYGSLFALAIVAFHHIHHAVSGDIPEDPLLHVIGELIAGSFGGALLFSAISALRNWHKARR